MKMCRAVGCVLVCALGLSLSCRHDETTALAPLEVGTLASVSGDLASLGQEFTDATSLAVEEINAAGGVLGGRTLKLVVQDDGTSTDGARAGYQKLAAARVPVILGPTTSAQVSAVADLVAGRTTVTIGRTTTADQLTTLDDDGYFFRLAPADVHQASLLATLVREAHVEHLCIAHRRDLYGISLAASVRKELEAARPLVAVSLADYDPSSSNLEGVLDHCASLVCPPSTSPDGGADAGVPPCKAPASDKVGLLLITFIEDGALILDDAQRKGWSARSQHFFFSDGAYDRGLLTRVKDRSNLDGAIGTAPAGPDPGLPEGETLRRFVASYKARFNRDPSIFVENAFDAMYVAAMAIEIAKTATPGPEIRDAMSKVSVPGGRKVLAGDWASIRTAIASGEPVDFEGASGPVDFDSKGDIKPPYTYLVWKVGPDGLTVTGRRTVATP